MPDETQAPSGADEKATAPAWAARLKTSLHVLAGLLHKRRGVWAVGDELTRAEYQAGLDAFLKEEIQ